MERFGKRRSDGSPNGRVFEQGQNLIESLGTGPWIKLDREITTIVQSCRNHVSHGAPVNDMVPYLREWTDYLVDESTAVLGSLAQRANGRRVDISIIHLMHTVQTIEQRVMWPVLCAYGKSNTAAESYRRELSADMYGYCGEQLEHLYRNPKQGEFVYDEHHRIGGITELTALALLNRQRSGNRITLLGTPHEDRQGVDLVHYVNDNGNSRSRHIQVKTSPFTSFSGENIDLLNAVDLGNRDADGKMTYRTTEAIIMELQGGRRAAEATEYLDKVVQLPKIRTILES